MKSITLILFFISALLLLGAIKFLLDLSRPGVYPPKQLLKKRAAALAGGGGIFLVIAIILSSFIF
ncbi:hypothetical protein [Bacillus sp. MRMR6]|uniref:hypothetical protein n=1 Tax=Bacillus sp. MRMR6 TaxID=1928617 RepID=UPI0009517004|nr:hypothetical protein [Bacillus sp. MRMR6]OLS36464.1 hypothetical protein BTR25_17750 [Bacillus sp. MRMR6]